MDFHTSQKELTVQILRKLLQPLKSAKNCLILALIALILLQTVALRGMFKLHETMDQANTKMYVLTMICFKNLELERESR